MTSKTVAFLDILGFKQLVENHSASSLGEKYSNLMTRALNTLNKKLFEGQPLTFFPNFSSGDTFCKRHVFSDSIILISHNDSEESCLSLLIHALKVMQVMIGNKLPLRGAITHGEMYADFENSLFLGKALTNAYELEQKQNWIGAIIDDSVPTKFPQILTSDDPVPGLRQKLFPLYEVPMKTGDVRRYHVINWRWNLVSPKGTQSFFDDSGKWAFKMKVDATLEFAKKMREQDMVYPTDSTNLPLEVGRIYIAEGPPTPKPPSHGDEY